MYKQYTLHGGENEKLSATNSPLQLAIIMFHLKRLNKHTSESAYMCITVEILQLPIISTLYILCLPIENCFVNIIKLAANRSVCQVLFLQTCQNQYSHIILMKYMPKGHVIFIYIIILYNNPTEAFFE